VNVHLIDFDWAGPAELATYQLGINGTTIRQRDGAPSSPIHVYNTVHSNANTSLREVQCCCHHLLHRTVQLVEITPPSSSHKSESSHESVILFLVCIYIPQHVTKTETQSPEERDWERWRGKAESLAEVSM
jgi:hypothetical protein